MPQPLNLYADKVFSEHPLGLWPMDEANHFLSLFSQNNKSMQGWAISGGTKEVVSVTSLEPPVEGPTVQVSTDDSLQVSLESGQLISFDTLDRSRNTLNISFYIYSQNASISSVDLGIKYGSTEDVETFDLIGSGSWVFVSRTIDIPDSSDTFSVVLKINAESSGSYSSYINGLSLGQWSERYNTYSSGTVTSKLQSLATNPVALFDFDAVSASAYGLSDDRGYYLASANKLFAYNDGIPLVYGSSNSTQIINNPDGPSVIIPGKGFLNDAGRNRDYTLEFWMRASLSSSDSVRICGPISSDDGLYVDKQFLTLKVADQKVSHFIKNWGRPMLIDIRFIEGSVSLMINGEEVAQISINNQTVDLPTKFDESIASIYYGADQDWIGFYGSENLATFSIESPAIYSYPVPSAVAKRRFVYGQGVEYPNSNNEAISGTSAVIDYRNAGYANNVIYPDTHNWDQGLSENIDTQNKTLSAPRYELPSVILNGSSYDNWLENSKVTSRESTRPHLSFDGFSGHLLFQSLDTLKEELSAFYVIFRSNSTDLQTVLYVEDKTNGNYFEITISGNDLIYTLNYSGTITSVTRPGQNISGITSAAGVNLATFSSQFGENVQAFFGSRHKLRMYVASRPNLQNQFTGRVYKVGFASPRNAIKIEQFFDSEGISLNIENLFQEYLDETEIDIVGGQANTDYDELETLSGGAPDTFLTTSTLYGHTATYTLSPKFYLDAFILDVDADLSWQDYRPLSFFAKDNKLDYMQFNVTVPKTNKIVDGLVDASDSSIRTYVAFDYTSNGANRLSESYTNTVSLPESRVVYPTSTWASEKYEVVDGSIIYPPEGVPFNDLAIIVYIDADIPGVNSSNMSISSLQLASQVLNEDRNTKIKTKFGQEIYTSLVSGIYPLYTGKNPVQIYKNSTPYLYLCDDSGIRLAGNPSPSRGIVFPINEEGAPVYRLGAVQMFLNYNQSAFPATPEQVFRLETRTSTVDGFIVKESGDSERGLLYLRDEQGNQIPDVSIYINGKLVKDAYLMLNQWDVVAIQIGTPMDFDSFTSGSFTLMGKANVDAVSSYKIDSSKTGVTTRLRTWAEVEGMLVDEGINPATWGDFLSQAPPISWGNVLYIPTTIKYLIDMSAIYRAYMGTSKIIVRSNSTVLLNNYKYGSYFGVDWDINITTPV